MSPQPTYTPPPPEFAHAIHMAAFGAMEFFCIRSKMIETEAERRQFGIDVMHWIYNSGVQPRHVKHVVKVMQDLGERMARQPPIAPNCRPDIRHSPTVTSIIPNCRLDRRRDP